MELPEAHSLSAFESPKKKKNRKVYSNQLREENEPASYSFLIGTSDRPLELGPGIRKPLFIHQVLTIFGQGRCGQNMGTSPQKKWLGVPLLFLSPTSIPQQRIFGTVGAGCWLSPWEDLPEALRFFWMGSFGTGSSLLRNARRFWWGLWLQIVGFPLNQPKNGYIGSAKTVGPPKKGGAPQKRCPKNRVGPQKSGAQEARKRNLCALPLLRRAQRHSRHLDLFRGLPLVELEKGLSRRGGERPSRRKCKAREFGHAHRRKFVGGAIPQFVAGGELYS